MYVWCIYSWSWYTWPWCTYIWCMTRAFIHDPDTCMYDACIFGLRSLTLIHVYMCDAYIYYPWSWHMCVWWMYSWCGIFVMHGQTLTLMHIYMMHVCTMHIHMLLDHYAYVHDVLMYDAYIHDPWYLTMLHVCVWCTYLWSWTSILKHACMYGACIYDAANFVTNERTRRF